MGWGGGSSPLFVCNASGSEGLGISENIFAVAATASFVGLVWVICNNYPGGNEITSGAPASFTQDRSIRLRFLIYILTLLLWCVGPSSFKLHKLIIGQFSIHKNVVRRGRGWVHLNLNSMKTLKSQINYKKN